MAGWKAGEGGPRGGAGTYALISFPITHRPKEAAACLIQGLHSALFVVDGRQVFHLRTCFLHLVLDLFKRNFTK